MSDPQITKQMLREHPSMAGMMQLPLYVVFSRPVAGLLPIMEQAEAHLQHQITLEKQGIMFAAGPLFGPDDSDWSCEGMFVIRAASIDEATAIASQDPMHIAGARSFTVRPWLVNEGSISVTISLSQCSASLA